VPVTRIGAPWSAPTWSARSVSQATSSARTAPAQNRAGGLSRPDERGRLRLRYGVPITTHAALRRKSWSTDPGLPSCRERQPAKEIWSGEKAAPWLEVTGVKELQVSSISASAAGNRRSLRQWNTPRPLPAWEQRPEPGLEIQPALATGPAANASGPWPESRVAPTWLPNSELGSCLE